MHIYCLSMVWPFPRTVPGSPRVMSIGNVRVFDRSSFALRDEFRDAQQHTADIQSVAFLAGDRMIVSAGGYAILKLWDAATGKCLGSLLGHTDKIWGVSVSPDGTTLATASSDGTVKLWDPMPRQLVGTLTQSTFRISKTPTASASTPDGRTLIVARGVGGGAIAPLDGGPSYFVDADLEVRGFDLNSGTESFHHLLEKGKQTYGANLSSGGTYVAFVFPDRMATTWEVATGKRLATVGEVSSLAWAGDHLLFVSGRAESPKWWTRLPARPEAWWKETSFRSSWHPHRKARSLPCEIQINW